MKKQNPTARDANAVLEEIANTNPSFAVGLNTADLLHDLGATVRKLRSYQLMTQAELAARAGMHQAEISRLERGQYDANGPTLMVLSRLLSALHARVEILPEQQPKSHP